MKKILIVDDDEAIRRMLNFHLKKEYQVFLAEGGEVALGMLKNEAVDLILLDQMMPDMDGLMTFEKIKEKFSHPPPVVMITAHGSLHLAVEFMKNGGVDFIQKPMEIEVLKVKINQAIKAGEALKKLRQVEAEKIELETLLTTVATLNHEINNSLGAIGLAESLLIGMSEMSTKAVKYLTIIKDSVERIKMVIQELSQAMNLKKTSYAGGSQIYDLSDSKKEK